MTDSIAETYKTDELNSMLQWSSLVYRFTTLRALVRDNKDTIPFEKTELILTQDSEEESPYKGTHLKYPVPVKDVIEFIKTNRKYLKKGDGGLEVDPEGGQDTDDGELNITKFFKQVALFDADIVDFDDEFVSESCKSELVFSIIVNRTEKRFTVTFRGSVSTKDWMIDASIRKTTPDMIKSFAGEDVEFHRGFVSYLLGDTHEGNSKVDQIVTILKDLYAVEAYKDYDLYITGHSLGGALAQFLAFTLAGTLDTTGLAAKKVIAITYASPRVGNKVYMESFKALEKAGKLRHIRVSNDGDVVAVAPSFGYYQTGVNFHVKPKGMMEVGYCIDRNFFSQLRLNSASMHGLKYYHERIFREENEHLIKMDVEDIYSKFVVSSD